MAVTIGSARIDENGNARGGRAGDQTGKEVSKQNWYLHSKGWTLIRAKDAPVREKIAVCMEAACANDHIGYDQGQRDTLYDTVKPLGFDVSRLEKDVETDCSALVRVCVCFAGVSVGGFRTTNEAETLSKTGAFDIYTDDRHCKSSKYLLRGDILVTRTQGHTVVALSDGSGAAEEAAAAYVEITGGTVHIRMGNGTLYASVKIAKKGERYPFIATAANGWRAVGLPGQVGWISPRYTKRV